MAKSKLDIYREQLARLQLELKVQVDSTILWYDRALAMEAGRDEALARVSELGTLLARLAPVATRARQLADFIGQMDEANKTADELQP